MSAFSYKRTFGAWDANEQMRVALERPFSFDRAITENVEQGILDSPGLGTAIRSVSTPPLADTRPQGRYEGLLKGGADADTMSEDEFKASPYYRDAIPFEKGMTEARAAALASSFDVKQVRAHYSQKQPVAAFLGAFIGQAFDPINYVPVFGVGARTYAVARAGNILGHALVGASEAAISTAAASLLTADIRRKFGDDVSWEGMVTDVAMSAVIGAAFGGAAGFVGGRNAKVFDFEAEKMARANRSWDAQYTLKNQAQARIPLNEAVSGLVEKGHVDLTPNGVDVVQRIKGDVESKAAVVEARPGEVPVTHREAASVAQDETISARAATVAAEMPDPVTPASAIGFDSARRADAQPDNIEMASAAVGKPIAMRELAEQHGVDMVTGDYPESFEIEQLRAEGRVSAEDDAVLMAADETYTKADAYGSALKSALACVLRG